jgi:hypothetical protein
MKPEDVADIKPFRSDDIVLERPKDAAYVAIAVHRYKTDVVVIWTGLLGWVPLTDAIPAQLLDIVQARSLALRALLNDKFKVNVIRVVPPMGRGPVTIN